MKLQKRVLYKVASPFTDKDTEKDKSALAFEMVLTMQEQLGIGLAAPQVGVSKRLFVMWINGNVYHCFNPEVLSVSDKTSEFQEGCLSFPDEEYTLERPEKITVSYEDFRGNRQEREFSGIEARCFLHELDHLNGITFKMRQEDTVPERFKNYVKQ